MKIDRDRFLVLTATLAMGVALAPAGCATEAPPQAPVPPPPQPAPAPTVIYVLVPAAPMPMASNAAPTSAPTATPAPAPSPAPTPPLPPVAQSPDPYKGTPIHGQSCDPGLNAKGAVPACAIRPPPGPTCESIHDTQTECPTLNKLLKPRVAQAAIECLNRRSGTKDICEFNVSSICAYEALQTACIDPSAKKACDGVVARCGAPSGHYNKMTRDACEAGVSGIADNKRAKFISCITEFCRFEVCLAYL